MFVSVVVVTMLGIMFPHSAEAAETTGAPAVAASDLSKYKSTIEDPDIQLIKKSLRNIGRLASRRTGGNVSGGGDNILPLSDLDREIDGASLEAFQLGLIGAKAGAAAVATPGKNRIAIVDSGLEPDSRAARNAIYFTDFTNRCSERQMCDESLHGTLVADLIWQAAPSAELVVLKVLSESHSGSFSAVIDALKWLNRNHKQHDIRIVNLSLVTLDRMSGFWDEVDEAKALLRKLSASGVIIVSAAGNDFKKEVSMFPANTPESITVGSFSHHFSNDASSYTQSLFSNRGYAEEQDVTHFKIPLLYESTTRKPKAWHLKPEVTAPGEGLFACAGERCYLVTDTSFAAALVSGGLHGTLANSPGLTRSTFLEKIRSRCPSPSFTGTFDGTKSCAVRFDLGI